MDWHQIELVSLWVALSLYSAVTVLAMVKLIFQRSLEKSILGFLGAAVALHTLAIAARWVWTGAVPVVGAFEMLSANIWGLSLALWIGAMAMPKARVLVAVVMPVIIMLMAWMLLKPSADTALPPTYKTVWLFVHIGFIKIFMGCAFIALGMAVMILLRRTAWGAAKLANQLSDRGLDERAYRFMAMGLIFDTLGIIAGAIWAQDAWGHYWSWDPLEVWSLVTWLTIGLTLHLRASYQITPRTHAWMIVLTWVVAFFTFFGIPFVSVLHKGMI